MKNTAHIDLNDKNKSKARFIHVNQLSQIDSQLTAKLYVDNSTDESSVVRNIQDIDFINDSLTNIGSITLNTQAVNDNQVKTKAYVDQFHQENERSRRDLGIDFYDDSNDLLKNNQDNDLNDKKLTIVNSITITQNPTSDNQVVNKKNVDDSIGDGNVLRFNQRSENYLEVSVGNDIYDLMKYNKIQINDITEIRSPNSGNSLLQKWILTCTNKSYNTKINTFLKSITSTSPTSELGAASLPPIGWDFMYVESSGNIHGANHVMVSWERTDISLISHIKFIYKRFSTSDLNLRGMGRFRIQIILEDNSWSTIYNTSKNSQYSNGSTVWYLFDSDITQENYGAKFI